MKKTIAVGLLGLTGATVFAGAAMAFGPGKHFFHNEDIKAAIDANDYAAFVDALSELDSDAAQKITQDGFDDIVAKDQMHDEIGAAIESNDYQSWVDALVNHATRSATEQRAQIVSSMTAFLTAIAAVALLVGAVGIANTMFTSVLEKTKEIGIMKAIGATNKDILVIFLLNAALIGLIGGLLGIFFGYILSGYLPALLGGALPFGRGGASTIITLKSVVMALLISIGIGTLSGAVPAYQASRLRPVDALRYE